MGKPKSEETKKKMSEAAKRRFVEHPEHMQMLIKKAAEMRKAGQFPVSEETRKKLAEAGKKRFQDPAERDRQRRKWTKEQHAHARVERKERWENPDFREKVISAITGKKRKQSTKNKIAMKARERWADPEFKQKMEEIRQKPEVVKRVSENAKKCWRNPDYRHRVLSKWNNIKSPTSIEIAVQKVLDNLGIKYEAQKFIGFYVVDLYLPDLNLVIECDGDYWHGGRPSQMKADQKRDKWLRSNGYRVLRLKECDIKKDTCQTVTNGLKRVEAE